MFRSSELLIFQLKKDKTWIEPIVEKSQYSFEVRHKKLGHKRHELTGTVDRNGGVCLVSGTAMPLTYIRDQAKKGNLKQRLLAIVAEGKSGRAYVAPSANQEEIAFKFGRPEIPDIALPPKALGFRVQAYGMKTYGDLFTDRQLVALDTFSKTLQEINSIIKEDCEKLNFDKDLKHLDSGGAGAKAYADAVSLYLAFAIDRLADANSTISTWSTTGFIRFTFARQAIPMTWDFAECNVLGVARKL